MKILHIISSLNPCNGGPIEGVKQLALASIKMGHETEILVTEPRNSPWLADIEVKVHSLEPSFLRYAFAPKLIPWLRQHAAEYDVIVIQGLWQYLGVAARNVLVAMNVPYCIFTHGQLGSWFETTYPIKHLKKSVYWKLIEHKNLRDAQCVFFTSEEERRQSREAFKPYKAVEAVVGYGTVEPLGDVVQQKERFYSQFPVLRDKKLFLFVGRLARVKACDLLIKAFAEVTQGAHDLHLVMVGPDLDGWKGELVELGRQLGVDSRITWTGMLTGDMKWGAFRAADCFILPSHHESFGVVVAEALSCGVPTLISNRVSIWQEVLTADAGFIANDDLPGVVENFRRWIALSCEEKNVKRRNAIQCFKDNFEIGLTANTMIKAISTFPGKNDLRF